MLAVFFDVLALLVLTLFNAFLSMSEMAIVSANRTRLEKRAEEGDVHAQRVIDLAKNPSHFLSAIQIGLTLISIGMGALGTATLAGKVHECLLWDKLSFLHPYANTLSIIIVVIFITFVTLILGEIVPKRIALSFPEVIAMNVSSFVRYLVLAMKPFVSFLGHATTLILKVMRIDITRDLSMTEEELQTLLRQGLKSGIIDPSEQKILYKVIGLADRDVSSIMTRRSKVYWVDAADESTDIAHELRQCPFSRIVVAKNGSIDEPLGYIQKKDVLNQLLDGDPLDIEKNLREPVFIPEGASVLNILKIFREKRNHFAFVIDEFGAFEGVITLTDFLESITGSIPEEHDEENYEPVVAQNHGAYLVDGRTQINELHTTAGIELPSEEGFTTVAGFVLGFFDRIPSKGEEVSFQEWRIQIIDMDGQRISKLLFTPAPEQSQHQ